jgi:anti-anti-sigma factor
MPEDLFEVSTAAASGPAGTARGVRVIRLLLPETLDSSEFERLNESLLSLLSEQPGGAWVLDLSELSYVGSAVLGLFVNLRQRVKQSNGRLVLCGLSDRLLQIFRTCSLERLFVIRRSQDEAIGRAR